MMGSPRPPPVEMDTPSDAETESVVTFEDRVTNSKEENERLRKKLKSTKVNDTFLRMDKDRSERDLYSLIPLVVPEIRSTTLNDKVIVTLSSLKVMRKMMRFECYSSLDQSFLTSSDTTCGSQELDLLPQIVRRANSKVVLALTSFLLFCISSVVITTVLPFFFVEHSLAGPLPVSSGGAL
nr:hypothetical protein [Tanacetum cinerariifolium]